MKTKVLTQEEFSYLIYGNSGMPKKKYSIDLDKIRYFSFDDICRSWMASEKHTESLRYVVCYDKNHIYGALKFAWFEGSKNYSITYCSTNKEYVSQGICKEIIKVFCEYFSNTYPDENLNISQYSVSGWKYLRPTLLRYSKINNITFVDNIVGYFDDGKVYDKEYYELRDLSIKIVGRNDY